MPSLTCRDSLSERPSAVSLALNLPSALIFITQIEFKNVVSGCSTINLAKSAAFIGVQPSLSSNMPCISSLSASSHLDLNGSFIANICFIVCGTSGTSLKSSKLAILKDSTTFTPAAPVSFTTALYSQS